jgi:hypothetical protein
MLERSGKFAIGVKIALAIGTLFSAMAANVTWFPF